MYRYICCLLCIIFGAYAGSPMGSTRIIDTKRGSVFAMGSATVSNSHVSYLHVNGSADVSQKSHMTRVDINGAITATDSTIDGGNVNGPIKVKNSYIGDISCQGAFSAHNTIIQEARIAGAAEVTRCSGKSCAISGYVQVTESNFDAISIDSRYEQTSIYPMYITNSRVDRISVRGVARDYPVLHIMAPQDHMQVTFTKSRGTVITDYPHMITVYKGDVQKASEQSSYDVA